MLFPAVNGTRPVRLSEATRRFADESLHHKYGRMTRETPHVVMDDIPDFGAWPMLKRYDAAIARIADEAPIRICDGERISGAATLGDAINHVVPAVWQGEPLCLSISHLTIDFQTVLAVGMDGIRRRAEAALEQYRGTDKQPFAESCVNTIDSMARWHARYLEALAARVDMRANLETLRRVPFGPAETFLEAVQSIWFCFAFVRLTGNWPGIGRIDVLLGDYLDRDLAAGRLTLDEAREILAHFFIKGCEWICGGDYGSGDAQHYQNLVLAGVDVDGHEVTNAVTYLVLDIIEELGISDFPTTVRIGRHTDKALLTRVAEVLRLGGGVLAVYNEDLIIESLTDYGYSLREARQFANDGCWEVQIPGKTYFVYHAVDALEILQTRLLNQYDGVYFDDFESLYAAYRAALHRAVRWFIGFYREKFVVTDAPPCEWAWKPDRPCTVVSLFEEGCIEKGQSYQEGGPLYNVTSIHLGGLPDVVDSLYAIKKLVFDDQKIGFADLMTVLKNNWEGEEALRRFALGHYRYYGNDNDEVDAIAARIAADFADACDEVDGTSGYRTPAGISTFGRQIQWAPTRLATPSGKKAHEVLSGNLSPAPGFDREGATAIIRSYCKTDLKRIVSGGALDIKLLPSAVKGDNGLEALVSLMRGFVSLGGFFMQPDIADTELLLAAQAHPEEYPTLSVRVSGWNARFVTLNKEWQDMIIAQTGGEI